MSVLDKLIKQVKKNFFAFIENGQQLKEKQKRDYILSSIDCNKDKVSFGIIAQFCGGDYIHIGDGTNFEQGVFLTAWDKYLCLIDGREVEQHFSPKITIGKNCHFGVNNHITCINSISIGDNILTGKWVTITDNSHGNTDVDSLKVNPIKRPLVSKGSVSIGNNVWIGDKATILPGVHIGNGAVIGANSVVSIDIPENSVAVGNPIKVVKNGKQL